MSESRKTHASSSPLQQEVGDRFGVLPNFFRLAPDTPEITANLWGFARFGYLDNPLPALFKERLFVYLSRFCEVRYCISRHLGFLVGLGRPAGDAASPPESLDEVWQLIRRPLPRGEALEPFLAQLETCAAPLPALPESNSPFEEPIFAVATHVFLQTPQATRSLDALRRLLDSATLQHLLVFLAFVRTAHFWTKVHPELELEADVSDLLAVHKGLAECIANDPESASCETTQSLLNELADLRREREQAALLRTTLASIGDAVLTTDAQGRVTFLNDVAIQLTGWTQAEAAGQPAENVFQIINEITGLSAESPIQKVLRCGAIVGLANHTLLIAKDGTRRPIDDSGSPIRVDDSIVGVVLVFRDVTQRRRDEAELLRLAIEADRQRRLYDTVLSNTPDFNYTFDLQGRFTYANSALLKLWRKTLPDAVGKNFFELNYPPELAARLQRQIQQVIDTRQSVRDETPFTSASGERQYEYIFVPVIGATGVVEAVAGSTRDITEQKRVQSELRDVAARLSEADRRKDEFLATLAHELRNPLAPIRTGLELMKLAHDDPATIAETRETMERQTQQMVRLIDDLLDVSRITQGKLELRLCRVALDDVVQSAVEATQPFIDEANHQLSVDLPAAPVHLNADPNRVAQIIANLLNNSTKYTPEGGHIQLTAQLDAPDVVISVRDNGVGIPLEMQQNIFELFAQIDRPLEKGYRGLGIGLTLVKRLVEMHDGTIEVASPGADQGTTFTIRLPYLVESTPMPQPTTPADSSPSRQRVLIVDDNADAAKMLSLVVKMLGNDIRVAYDGRHAIQIAAEFRPHVILMDIGMPIMNGYEAAQHLRAEPWAKDIVLVALTGWGQDEDKRRAEEAGFHHHLVKPAEPAELQKLLNSIHTTNT